MKKLFNYMKTIFFLLGLVFILSFYPGDKVFASVELPVIESEKSANVATHTFKIKKGEEDIYIEIDKAMEKGVVWMEWKISTKAPFVMCFLSKNGSKSLGYIGGNPNKVKEPWTWNVGVKKGDKLRLHIQFMEADQKMLNGSSGEIKLKVYEKKITPGTTLANNKWINIYGDITMPEDFKMVLPKSGLIEIECVSDKSKKISYELYSGKKKELDTYRDGNIYALEKGTYYIRPDVDGYCKLRYKFTPVDSEKSVTKKRAVILKQGEVCKTLIANNEENRDILWYKFTIPSQRQKITIEVVKKGFDRKISNSVGQFSIQREDEDGTVVKDWQDFKGNENKGTYTLTLDQGVYYLCFEGRAANNVYEIKWK